MSHLAIIKGKKDLMTDQLGGYSYNHPHRLATVELSGVISYTIDERDFTANASPSNGDIAYVFEFDLTFTGAAGYTRIFEDRFPWVSIPSGTPAQGEFLPSHRPLVYLWKFETDFGPDLAPEIIGTVTRTKYIYAYGSWGLDTTDPAEDITLGFSFFLSAGGDPVSGGRDDDSPDEKASIEPVISLSGTYSTKLPSFSALSVDRFPWDDPWSAETTVFSDAFTDHLTAQNATDGGGHSGTCTLSLDFT